MARRKSYRGTPPEHREMAVGNLNNAKQRAHGVLREVAQNECKDAVGELIYMEREFARYKANRSQVPHRYPLGWSMDQQGPMIMRRARNAFIDKCIVKRKRR